MSRSAVYVFILSLALGLSAGAYIGWVVAPIPNAGAGPSSLQEAYQDDYVLMIAAAFAQDQNVGAARARLTTLGYADPTPALAATARRLIAAQSAKADLRRLAQLTAALGTIPPELQPFLP